MKDFFKKENAGQNIFERLSLWLDVHFEIIAYIMLALYVVGFIAFFTYTIVFQQKYTTTEQLWDLPSRTPGTYVRTDPDTDIEYIIVISGNGDIAVCPREGVNNVR